MAKYAVGEIAVIGEWFRLHYVLNPGMAYGLEIETANGKLILTTVRVLVICLVSYYLFFLVKKKEEKGIIAGVAMVLGGAIGNVIDGVFYGVFLKDNVSKNAPFDWFHGQVIDMLYFPIYKGNLPDWIPFLGGGEFEFFKPVFNLADACIFVGVLVIILIQNKNIFISIARFTGLKKASN